MMDESILTFSISLAIILFVTAISFLVIRTKINVFHASKNFSIPDILPTLSVDIPVLATYGGVKGLGMLSFLENNINPGFTLYDNYMEYKILTSKTTDYNQIAFVREGSILFFHYIQFSFSDRTSTFSAQLANTEIVKKVGDFFRARGIPVKEKGN